MRVFGPPGVDKLEAGHDVTGLIGALAGPDLRRRQEAAAALGRLNDPRAADALIESMRDPAVRDAAAISLLAMAPNVMENLVMTLRQANPFAAGAAADPAVRAMVATILGQAGDPRAVEPLIAALDDVREVGFAAMEALVQLRDPRGVDAVSHSLDRFGVAGVEALARTGDPRAVGAVVDWAVPHGQVRGDVQEAATAIRALGMLGPADEVRPFITRISRHFPGPGTPNGDVIEEAVLDAQVALGKVRVSD
jgi:hypothetical protein